MADSNVQVQDETIPVQESTPEANAELVAGESQVREPVTEFPVKDVEDSGIPYEYCVCLSQNLCL